MSNFSARYKRFRDALHSRPLVLDGSMGALLQDRGLPPGHAPDLWNLENPDAIYEVHREYALAGSDILITNTFGASRLRLQEYDAYDRLKAINQKAVELARRAAGDNKFVAGDIGPCGDTIYPTGQLPFAEAVTLFAEQAKALIEAGVDLIIVETMFDSLDFKAALSAVRSISREVPLVGLMTFNTDGLSDTGISPESTVAIAEGFHCDAVGANCSVGPDAMASVIRRMKVHTQIPLCAQPNAGMPELRQGLTCFPLNAEAMAGHIRSFFKSGARILGGCCGTTPEYIRHVRSAVDNNSEEFFNYGVTPKEDRLIISSKTDVLKFGESHPFVMIGEKINPTGRKSVAEKIRAGNIEALIEDARAQVQAGAHALDVNVGVPLIDEPAMMRNVIGALQNTLNTPLVIDSSFSEALLTGGEVYYGRPLLNSINAEDEKLDEVLPIARRTGGAILALVTETEVPETAEGRLIYARKILNRMIEEGFTRNDVVFDILSLTVSAMKKGAIESLRTARLIREELGCATTFGLSNSSFGLPNRRFVHQAYLMMAIQNGLNSAIMNVLEKDIAVRVAASQLFTTRNEATSDYLVQWSDAIAEADGSSPANSTQQAPKSSEIVEDPTQNMNLDDLQSQIFWDVVEGKKEKIEEDTKAFIQDRANQSFELFLNVMTPAIRYLGDLFAARKKFIPHLVAAAEAMKAGVAVLEPYFTRDGEVSEKKGTIIFATVKGDIHHIGKNICVLMLKNFGYTVIDMGRNVPMDAIFERAKEEGAQIIALSALMTTTMIQMKLLVEENQRLGSQYRIMVGGAPVTKEFAREIGADGHSDDVGGIVTETEALFSVLGYQPLT
jgi:5-methyltetrahydrofolate--homocysteine methyltransferase